MTKHRAKYKGNLAEGLRSLSLEEGENRTSVPYMKVYRVASETIPMPRTDNSYLYIVADGSMRLYTSSGIMDYEAGQYSISQIDTPLAGHVLTFPEEDATAFMAAHIRRELIFHMLCGSCGKQFLTSVINISQAGEIYEANSWIKKNFRKSFTVEELAQQNNMSVSLFHQKFKSAVGMGPFQCQKRLRLTEARRLMMDENKNATEAAMEVGYESSSQFARDYRKMFGASPKEDILSKKQANFL